MIRTTRMLRMLMAGSVVCGALVLTGGAQLSSTQGPQTPEAVLGAAIHQEEAEGNLEAAIESYQTFLARHGDMRSLAVQALLRMGQAYERLGRPDAREAYERVLRDYADQAKQVSAARTRLAALAQPRSPADPSTMVVRRLWESPSADYFGGPSPDGRYLTYIDFATGNNLGVHDVVTGQQRPLTQKPRGSSGFAGPSTISPDGQQVAYGWAIRENPRRGELRLIGLDTRGPRVLYQNENEEVAWVHPHAWTPDGKQILALFNRWDNTNQLVLVSVADGSVRVLKSLGWNYPFNVDLSPDGRHIVYDFPPDENSPNRDIFLLATDGSREIPLMEHPADDKGPLWTPDGTKVVFASDRTGSTSAWVLRIADEKAQGPPELVKPDLGRFFPVGFDRNGSYYYELHTGMSDVYLATLNPVTGKLGAAPSRATQRFVGATYGAAWSPDGQSLAYVRRDAASLAFGSTVIIQSLDTGTERELSTKFTRLLGLRWFPDGRSLMVLALGQGISGIYRIDAQTGETAALVTDARPIGVSPDGEEIFYLFGPDETDSYSFVVRNLESGQTKDLYSSGGIDAAALSPDGRWLVFTAAPEKQATTTGDRSRADYLELKIMPAAGGEPRELHRLRRVLSPRGPGWTGWTPDGRHVLFVQPQEVSGAGPWAKELWQIPVEGGEPQSLGLAMEGLRDVQFHPDGQRIAFTSMRLNHEVWVMENFLPERDGNK